MFFNVTRTQLFGPDDLKKVEEIQGSYGLQPLSADLGEAPPAAAPAPDFPKWDEGSQFDERFFAYLDFMMSLLEKPADGEQPLWDRLARLGIGSGNTYDFDALSPELQDALKAGVKQGFDEIEKFIAENSSDPLMSGKTVWYAVISQRKRRRQTSNWMTHRCFVPPRLTWVSMGIPPPRRSTPRISRMSTSSHSMPPSTATP